MAMLILTGSDIRSIREALLLSPTDFAAKLGVSASAVSRWENEKGHPTIRKMMAINRMAEKAGVAVEGIE
jgi:DNA-binding transcriptional regulator YiaG